MRSVSMGDEQGSLPFDPPAPATRQTTTTTGPRRRQVPADTSRRHRMETDSMASWGWPEGTELRVDPERTPERGQVVLVEDRRGRRIGVLALELGRVALRTDHGSEWIDRSTRIIGPVTQVDPPLAGMPESGLRATPARALDSTT